MKYLLTILRYQRKIFAYTSITAIIIVAISLMVPKVYMSKAIILPSGSTDKLGLLGGFGGLSNLAGNFDMYGKETADLMAILSSRYIREKLINEFNLMKLYEIKYIEDAILCLNESINIYITDEGTLSISISDKTEWFSNSEKDSLVQVRVRDMTQFFLNELDKINKDLKTQKAHYNRVFLEERYNKQVEIIDQHVKEYENYKERYNTIDIEKEAQKLIEISTDLQSQIIDNRVELEVLKENISEDNVKITSLEKEINSLENYLLKLKEGEIDNIGDFNIFHKFSDVPSISIHDFLLKEKLKVQYSIMEFIAQQYEEAKLQEAKDTPTIQILDYPQIPNIKERPKRSVMVIAVTFFAFILSCLYVIWLEYLKELQKENKTKYNQIHKMFYYLRHGFFRRKHVNIKGDN